MRIEQQKKNRKVLFLYKLAMGIEPMTSTLPMLRATICAMPACGIFLQRFIIYYRNRRLSIFIYLDFSVLEASKDKIAGLYCTF